MAAPPVHFSLLARAGICGVLCMALSHSAHAGQRLVSPGEDWQALAAKIKPGDEIILMPGRHRPATFESLIGTAQKPIIIRGADPNKPSYIESQREGIRIKRAAHLVIKDLSIIGGTISGIAINVPTARPPVTIDPALSPRTGSMSEAKAESVIIQNVSISKVGPRGQRHGIIINMMQSVRIENCQFEGWGGSGVEVIASNDVLISRCNFSGLNDHSQLCGIRVRAGSDDVRIEECRFTNAGERGICIGASSNVDDFRQPLPDKASPDQPLTEASHVSVERCIISNSACAIAFVNSDDCTARNNTILRPRRCAVGLLTDQKDSRFSTGQRNIFGMNIVIWQPRELKRLIENDPGVKIDKFLLEQNAWWSGEPPEQVNKLGPLPKSDLPQIMDADPRLNDKFKPGEPRLQGFGA